MPQWPFPLYFFLPMLNSNDKIRPVEKKWKEYRFDMSAVCIQSINMHVNIEFPFCVHQLHTQTHPGNRPREKKMDYVVTSSRINRKIDR